MSTKDDAWYWTDTEGNMTTNNAYIEQIPARFAELLTTLADEYGAPIFAADVAEKGANPDALNLMADRWVEGDFDHQEAAAMMRDLAGYIERANR